jgi:peptidoglycan/LPS O-acetylase OafA/YrhL
MEIALSNTDVAPRLGDGQVHSRFGHIPGLDGLRALSIMIVMVGHFLLGKAAALSTIGVYIFFVISGYLITRLMLAEQEKFGSVDMARFYARRFLRLYPVIIVFLIVIVGVAFLAHRPRPPIEVASILFYFANYLTSWQEIQGSTFQLPIGILWSLSVEEHFYLLMPIFFVAMRGRHMVPFAIAMCIIPVVLRVTELQIWPWLADTSVLYRNSDVRFDSIAYGVLLAGISNMREPLKMLRRLGSPWMVVLGGVFLIVSFVMPDGMTKAIVRDTFRSWAAVPIVCSVLFSDKLGWTKHILELPLIAWVGTLSYSLYVWHGAQEYFLTAAGVPDTSFGFGWMRLAGAFACAITSFYLIERPALRFKDRLRPRPRGPVISTAPGVATSG